MIVPQVLSLVPLRDFACSVLPTFCLFHLPGPSSPETQLKGSVSSLCSLPIPPSLPHHQGTQSSNSHSMLVEDRTDAMPISHLVCIDLLAFSNLGGSLLLPNVWEGVRCSLFTLCRGTSRIIQEIVCSGSVFFTCATCQKAVGKF